MQTQSADQLTRYLNVLGNLFDIPSQSPTSLSHIALSKRDCRVILVIGQAGEIKMRDLATHAKLSVTNLTGVIERLLKQGLVHRERSTEDRRIVNVSLSEAGLLEYAQEQEKFRQVSLAILNALEPHEQVMMLAMMRKVAEGLKSDNLPSEDKTE